MRIGQMGRMVSHICALLLAFSLITGAVPTQAQNQKIVGLELVLLVDVSASVSKEEFRLQLDGLAAAFTNPAVLKAIKASGGLAICIVQWAQQAYQYKTVDWMELQGDADALKLAVKIASMPRNTPSGQTAIGDALAFALNELKTNQYSGTRRVIDLSGDGRSNDGRLLRPARETVLKQGVTINGLAILNEVPDLKEFFRTKLIGGPGAFVLAARDYTDFSRAIREKLEREILPTPLAGNSTPNATPETRVGMALQAEPTAVR